VSTELESHRIAWALDASVAAALVANYCDHVEHNEQVDRDWLETAGRMLRQIACEIAEWEGRDLLSLYANRLRAIEHRNPCFHEDGFDGGARAEEATTWRQLQLVQVEHDHHYHPDVIGLSKCDQLRHYSLHLTKLSGALAELSRGSDSLDFLNRRLPDFLLFGIKLATVTGKTLPERSLATPSSRGQRQLAAA
jgi:hypothetical protein